MKYYSDETKQLYDTEAELKKAEQALVVAKQKEEALKAQRSERAKEVEDAFKAVEAAQKHAHELLNAFTKDYGSFHMSLSSTNNEPLFPLFDILF